MRFNLIKIFLIISFIFFQTEAYSKVSDKNKFNHKYLSNYFSALVSYDAQDNQEVLKYFNLSKSLEPNNIDYFKKYIFTLINAGQISKAIKEINNWENKGNSNFFETNILLLINNLINKNYEEVNQLLLKLNDTQNQNAYDHIIYETLESYLELFQTNEILDEDNNKFGRLSAITSAFQNCYIDSEKTDSLFLNLINSSEGDYSRYLFFYFSKKVEEKDFETIKQISSTIDPINNGLIILQSKNWVEKLNFKKFSQPFSCKNKKHLLSEFFFLIANLYAAEEDYILSNFYLNISNYLNPRFYFNLTLIIENNYITENYEISKKILNKFNNQDELYKWYKIKKIYKIISQKENNIKSLNFIESEYDKIKNPSTKIVFDMANIYKSSKKYKKAIELYTLVMNQIDRNSDIYAEILYRRGGSYERLKNYKDSDIDLLNSLELVPNDPYVTNYLAYSWLERNYKIKEALSMLEEAYEQRKNDPYIIDSIGWAHYLIKDYEKAKKYLLKAIKLMPNDPIVNDHYGDILWMLDKKIQARYFWKNALIQNETDEKLEEKIKEKLLKGMSES